jgi:Flp pilus assembly pilin Flp
MSTGRGKAVLEDAGATIVEYALLLTLVAVAAAGAFPYLDKAVNNTLRAVAGQIAGDTCAYDGGLEIQVQGGLCDPTPTTATFAITATLGRDTGFQLTSYGASGDVTYSCAQCPNDEVDLHPDDGSLTILRDAPDGAIPVFQISATDSSNQTASIGVSVLVAPTVVEAVVAVPASAECTYQVLIGKDYLDRCQSYTWLDGWYIHIFGGWSLIVAGDPQPGQVLDNQAFNDGTRQGGSAGAPSGPWTCLSWQGTYCTQLATNVSGPGATPQSPGGSDGHSGESALGTIGPG